MEGVILEMEAVIPALRSRVGTAYSEGKYH